jgi:GST-like protein
MPLTLFGSPGSGSAAVEMALRAASVEYEVVRASSWEPQSETKRLLEVNPLGQIPTLVLLDGTVLTESAAILISIALQYPLASLLPEAESERALAIRGLIFISANCYAAVSVSDYPNRWTTAKSHQAREQVRQAARKQLHRGWEIFADTFASERLLSIERPGALAFLAVVVSQWSGSRAHLRESRPAFFEALGRLESHPRVAEVLRVQGVA